MADKFHWLVSLDDHSYTGYNSSSPTNGWQLRTFDLMDASRLGDLSGQPQVWFALHFTSNDDLTGPGTFVDDVALHKSDWGMAFLPNPIATSGDLTLSDANNADDPRLTQARSQVGLPNLDESGFIRGDYIDLAGSHPDLFHCDTLKQNGQAQVDLQIYDYTRSDDRFEEVNIYYHLNQFRQYIHTLGYTNTLTRTVSVHPHCFEDDTSYASKNFTLLFGDGGVDDAEDGKVVVHEYAHLLLLEKFGVEEGTFEYKAIEEGFADYWAISFFADHYVSPTLQTCFAEWDAAGAAYTSYTNPSCYRRLDNNKRYPNDIIGEEHADGEIYTGALWQLWKTLTPTTTDKLVLESLKYMEFDDHFSEAGEALVMADQTLNEGQNIFTIATTFKARGIFDIYEWNDTPEWANLIIPDGTPQIHSFFARQDVDWLDFEAIPPHSDWQKGYYISTLSLSPEVDTTLTLYDRDQTTILAYNDDCTEIVISSCLTWIAPTTGTYYLQIKLLDPDINNTGITTTYQVEIVTQPISVTLYLPIIKKQKD